MSMVAPQTISANFTIPASATTIGGRLEGAGFGAATPRLDGGDSIQVVVTWGGNNAPSQLTAYLIFSPAQGASQTGPSPFMNGSNYLCYTSQTASANGQRFTFPSFTIPQGTAAGNYELTIVVDNSGMQWSEDPEFDTTGN